MQELFRCNGGYKKISSCSKRSKMGFLQYYVTISYKSYCYKQSELLIRETGWAIPWKRSSIHFQPKLKARVFTDVTKVYNKVSRGKNINVRE